MLRGKTVPYIDDDTACRLDQVEQERLVIVNGANDPA